MTYKQLYIFVEGDDDERFVNQIIKPLMKNYSFVKLIKYSGLRQQEIVKFIQTFNNQVNTDYIFFCDLDSRGNALCVTQRKEKEQAKYSNCFDNSKIIVVKEEIESWYLAGISAKNLGLFKIKPFMDTEAVAKEDFERLIPKNFTSKIDFIIEVLKEYSLEESMTKNGSLAYFIRKFALLP
jgi:hypothetical protein